MRTRAPRPPRCAGLRLALLAAAAAPAGPRGAAAQPVDAVQYTFHLTSAETDPRGRRTAEPAFVGRVQVAGTNVGGAVPPDLAVRVDIVAGRDGYPAGDYVLTDADGARLLVVSPARGTVREVSSGDAFRQAGRRVRVAITDPEVRVDTLPPGDAAGAPPAARRLHVVRTFVLQLRVLFMRQRSRVTERTDYWLSDAWRDVPNPLFWFFTEANRAVSAGDAALAARTVAAERGVRRGVVRTRTHVVLEGDDGRQVSEAESWITDVRHVAVDAARFAVPAGYRRADR
jgi:hypothetical protein